MTGRTAAEISASVEQGVRSGALAAGAALPPVRGLAGTLGVSPATVAAAYRALRDRGLVETAGRAGTRVRGRPPVAVRGQHRPVVPAGMLDLSSGAPAVDLLPDLAPALARLAAGLRPVGYDAAGPLPALLDAARDRLAADGLPVGGAGLPVGGAGLTVGGAGLTVVGGALDGIERVLGAHLRLGDRVAVEDPGWTNLLDLVAALGLIAVPVPVDDAGPTGVGLAAALAAGVAAVVVTTRAQNPTGAAVSAPRARALRRLLREYPQTLLVEDDHAAELADDRPHHLVGATRHWAFVRSVSKPYGPDLRVAVVAGDETTVARVEGRMRLGTGWVSTLLQRLVAEAWRDPAVATAVGVARTAYRRRREALLAALAARGVAAHGASGINVWVPVPDETTAVTALRDAGYAVAPGAPYRLVSGPGIRVTVAALGEERIPAFADTVAHAVAPPGRRPPAV